VKRDACNYRNNKLLKARRRDLSLGNLGGRTEGSKKEGSRAEGAKARGKQNERRQGAKGLHMGIRLTREERSGRRKEPTVKQMKGTGAGSETTARTLGKLGAMATWRSREARKQVGGIGAVRSREARSKEGAERANGDGMRRRP